MKQKMIVIYIMIKIIQYMNKMKTINKHAYWKNQK